MKNLATSKQASDGLYNSIYQAFQKIIARSAESEYQQALKRAKSKKAKKACSGAYGLTEYGVFKEWLEGKTLNIEALEYISLKNSIK